MPSLNISIELQGNDVGVFYDPMIAKLIVWGENREVAIQRLRRALADYKIAGVISNVDFLRRLASHRHFQAADLATNFIDQHRSTLFSADENDISGALAQISLYLTLAPSPSTTEQPNSCRGDSTSPWNARDAWRMNAPSCWQHAIIADDREYEITVLQSRGGRFEISVADSSDSVYSGSARLQSSVLDCEINGEKSRIEIFERTIERQRELFVFSRNRSFSCRTKATDFGEEVSLSDGGSFKAPMNGTLSALFVEPGQYVEAGTTLAIMEAMKMEHALKAPSAGTVTDVFYSLGDLVDGGADLLSFSPES